MASSGYLYIQSQPQVWTVGFYMPNGTWVAETDWSSPELAAKRVRRLNGGDEGRRLDNGNDEKRAAAAAERRRYALLQAAATIYAAYCDPLAGPMCDHSACVDNAQQILAEIEKREPAQIDLRDALRRSVELQSHYAELLNTHDGGKRMTFGSADEWLNQLAELKRKHVEAVQS